MEGEVSFPATLEGVRRSIEFVKRSLEELGYPPKVRARLAIVVDEIVGNIAKHAYGASTGDVTLRFSVQQGGDAVEITFIDEGVAFSPLAWLQANAASAKANRRIGGQGIRIASSIADAIEYERDGAKNILRIRMLVGK